jgi:hypothetical protein
MRWNRLRASALVRSAAVPALLAGAAVACLLVVLGGGGKRAKASYPLAGEPDLSKQLSTDLEGTPSAADVRRARRPLSERKRLLPPPPVRRPLQDRPAPLRRAMAARRVGPPPGDGLRQGAGRARGRADMGP